MRFTLIGLAGLLALVLLAVIGHFLVIEVGREVVTLRMPDVDGSVTGTRLWVVDYDGDPWLHSAGAAWEQRMTANPEVELVRGGVSGRYVAYPDRASHAAIDAALRSKYGLADRWVRFLAPCDDAVLPVRLRPVDPTPPPAQTP